jgi:cellulose synthase/poly-beta-1,6-N-acetylglucosamine synthase-like glycosyltransferase
MLEWLTIGVGLGLAILLLTEIPTFLSFFWRLCRPLPPVSDGQLPKAAVILSLRGTDETLERCLQALMTQNYPQYQVVIVVDHPDDPVWPTAQRLSDQYGEANLRVELLAQRLETCSLKCSSSLQAMATLDDSFGVVALVDADMVPHANWLRELAAPLADPTVGAAGGIRWYMPSQPTWGAIVRYLWNVPAILFMYTFQIPWSGTLAFRRDAFSKAGLLDKWSKAYCEDTMTYAALKPAGMHVELVPHGLAVNRESCTVGGFFEWCVRQLLPTRLYYPGWWLVVVHGMITTLIWFVLLAMVLWAAVVQQWDTLGWLAGITGIYWFGQWFGLLLLEKSAQRVVSQRGEPTAWLSPLALAKLFLAIPLTQFLYCGVLLATMRLRWVVWRGIRYDFYSRWDMRRGDYVPFSSTKITGHE